jgi:hypothetical protein
MVSSLACADAPAQPGPGQCVAGSKHPPARSRRAGAELTPEQCIAAGCRHRRCRRAVVAAEHPGIARRLQALACMGWHHKALSKRLGATPVTVWKATEGTLWPLPRWLANAVDTVYGEFWDIPGPSLETAQIARRSGWAPAMAWDYDRPGDPYYTGHGIDDPDGVPALCWQRPTRPSTPNLAGELKELTATGLSPAQAAIRLYVNGAKLAQLRELLAVTA